MEYLGICEVVKDMIDLPVRTSVRKYGFKPYDVDTTFGSTGLAFNPILADDPQAT